MNMKLSEAFALMEKGRILRSESLGLYYKLIDGVLHATPKVKLPDHEWNPCFTNIYAIPDLEVHRLVKEKVQYYYAFYKLKDRNYNSKSSPSFTSLEHFLETGNKLESDYDFIQMIKVGEPV